LIAPHREVIIHPLVCSEHSDRVKGRAGRARDLQGCQDDHEFPALLLRAHFRQILELQAISHAHAHGGHLQRVNGMGQENMGKLY